MHATDFPKGSWQAAVRPVVDATLSATAMPGMLLALAPHEGDVEYLAVGMDERGVLLTSDSLFAVASIGKPATALAMLRLAAQGQLGLDDPLSRHLPDASAARDGATVRTLLCHTSGAPGELPAHAAPYTADLTWQGLAGACLATPPEMEPWTRVVYSNVGYGLAAIIVERTTGQAFNEALTELVLRPLGIEGYLGIEPPRLPVHVSGIGGEHVGSALEPFNSAFWRSLGLPWGGLVTTAAGAIALAQAFAMTASFLPPRLAGEATSDQTRGLPGGIADFFEWPRAAWGLGVELRGVKEPHWLARDVTPGSFGHAGSSGCFVWHDPSAAVTWAVLGTLRLDAWWSYLPALNATLLAATR